MNINPVLKLSRFSRHAHSYGMSNLQSVLVRNGTSMHIIEITYGWRTSAQVWLVNEEISTKHDQICIMHAQICIL